MTSVSNEKLPKAFLCLSACRIHPCKWFPSVSSPYICDVADVADPTFSTVVKDEPDKCIGAGGAIVKIDQKVLTLWAPKENGNCEKSEKESKTVSDENDPVSDENGKFHSSNDNKTLKEYDSTQLDKSSNSVKELRLFDIHGVGYKCSAKWWSRRFNLFELYDNGIIMDSESWFEVSPEALSMYIANNMNAICTEVPVPQKSGVADETEGETDQMIGNEIREISETSKVEVDVADVSDDSSRNDEDPVCGLDCKKENIVKTTKVDNGPCTVDPAVDNVKSARTNSLGKESDNSKIDNSLVHLESIVKLVKSGKSVAVDLCCGVGGNTMSMTKYFDYVWAMDCSLSKILAAKHNAEVYGVSDKIFFEQVFVDTVECKMEKFLDVAYTSPPWGGEAYRSHKVLQLSALSVDVISILRFCCKIAKNVVMFLPKNLDLGELIMLANANNFGMIRISKVYAAPKNPIGCVVYFLSSWTYFKSVLREGNKHWPHKMVKSYFYAKTLPHCTFQCTAYELSKIKITDTCIDDLVAHYLIKGLYEKHNKKEQLKIIFNNIGLVRSLFNLCLSIAIEKKGLAAFRKQDGEKSTVGETFFTCIKHLYADVHKILQINDMKLNRGGGPKRGAENIPVVCSTATESTLPAKCTDVDPLCD